MRIIKTSSFSKFSGSWDDQPNFYQPRYEKGVSQYLANDGSPDNQQDIEKMWHLKKKKKKKKKKKSLTKE